MVLCGLTYNCTNSFIIFSIKPGLYRMDALCFFQQYGLFILFNFRAIKRDSQNFLIIFLLGFWLL